MPSQDKPQSDTGNKSSSKPNMHEDTQTWDDTCSCEPEPRWQELEDEQDEADDKTADG